MSKPRIVLWDIETTHNVLAAFRLYGDFIPHRNILAERYVVCASWKELDEKRIHSVSTLDDPKRFKKNPHDDGYVVQKLHDVLMEADVIVAHNGDAYDLKFTEARMLSHGLSPLPPIQSIDTKKVAKRRFLFNSNRLDYLAHFLGVGQKIHTDVDLWLDILNGTDEARRKAIRKMVRYNRHDIELLEGVFRKLQPYVPNHLNRQLLGEIGCPRCGSLHIQSRQRKRRLVGGSDHLAITRTYPQYQCQTCGGWFRDVKPSNTGTKTRVLA